MNLRMKLAASAIAPLLSTPALAQSASSAEEVRSFFTGLDEQATEAVGAGSWRGVQDWAQRHLSKNATFAMAGQVLSQNGATMSYSATFDRQDLRRLGQMAAATNPSPGSSGALKDHAPNIDVRDVASMPGGGATAIIGFRETGRLDLARRARTQGGTRSRAQGGQGTMPPVVVQASSLCQFRLSKGQQGAIQIDIASCQTQTMM